MHAAISDGKENLKKKKPDLLLLKEFSKTHQNLDTPLHKEKMIQHFYL